MITCKCPANAALTTIPAQGCVESFGQIQKVAFQRLQLTAGEKNYFHNSAITQLSEWSAILSAADNGKIVISPYIQAPTVEAGAARTFGGGNETLGGVEMIIGREPTTFQGVIRAVKQSIIAAMKELQCEAIADNLGVYLFDENGNIGCLADDPSNANNLYPIPIRSLFIGDKTFGGLEAPDSNAIQWTFMPNYSDNFYICVPDGWNPLTDLVPPSSQNSNTNQPVPGDTGIDGN